MNRELTPWTGATGQSLLGYDPFGSFQRHVDRLFDDYMRPSDSRGLFAAARPAFPSLDVHETENAYQIAAELPGLESKDVELKLHDHQLVISGEKRIEHDGKNGERTYAERAWGRFTRAIPLESDVVPERIEAKFKNGVLEVTVPKNTHSSSAARKIEIKG